MWPVMERAENKKKPWMKYRHRVVRDIAYAVMYPYTRLKYNIKIDKFKEQGNRPYLILMNHQTAFDQFFVGMAFRGPVYYVASEDLFSNGWISSLLRWLVAPIPIKKQTSDVGAVKNCIRVAREGGTIAIAPEGNRTYSGRTGYMNPAIAGLARMLKLPIALFRIEGGYGVHPRWSDVVRRGRMHAYVSRVIEPEEFAGLSKAELESGWAEYYDGLEQLQDAKEELDDAKAELEDADEQLADGWENFGEFVSNAVLGLTYALPWVAAAAAVIALARCWIRKKKKQ